jgi:hypothetical protein
MAAKLDVMFTTAFVVLMLGQIDFVKGEASIKTLFYFSF